MCSPTTLCACSWTGVDVGFQRKSCCAYVAEINAPGTASKYVEHATVQRLLGLGVIGIRV